MYWAKSHCNIRVVHSLWSEWDALKKLRWSLIYKVSSSLNQTQAACSLQHAPQLWKLHDYVCFLLSCMWKISPRSLNFTVNTLSSILSPHLEPFAHHLMKKKRKKNKNGWVCFWWITSWCKWRKHSNGLEIVCFCLFVCLHFLYMLLLSFLSFIARHAFFQSMLYIMHW